MIESSRVTWILGNNIHDVHSYGIYLANTSYVFISENTIQNTPQGIIMGGSEYIYIHNQDISNFEYSAIWGIHSQNISITNSVITNNGVGLEFYQTQQIYISGNEISNSTGEYNVVLEGYAVSQIDIIDNLIRSNYTTPKGIVIRGNISDVTISNNKIEDHIEMGISIEPLESENDTVSDINIHNNSITFSYPHPEWSLYYGIHNSLPGIVDARYNWWGDNSGPYDRWVDQSIPVTNYNGKGSSVWGNVIYSNWDQTVVVEITATPGTQVKEGTDITLTANILAGNEPFTYSWAGDCSGDNESAVVPGTEGSYYCSVEVTDIDSDRGHAGITVVILNNPPEVSIAADPGTLVTEGTLVTLTALVTEGNAPFDYNWGGDCLGKGDTTQVPTSSGVYECNVTVTDNDGDNASASIKVIIFPKNMRVKYRLEALIYGKDPSYEKSWTTGNVCQRQKDCYENGDNIPTRIIIDGLMPKAPYSFNIEHDYIDRKGNIGFASFHNNQPLPQDVNAEGTTITLLSDTTPCAKGTCADYKVTFKATSDTVTIYWNSQLSDEASEWKGSSLQLRLKQGVDGKRVGNRTISINPKDLE
jgi:parallel beta-helix repeat protein